MRNRQPILPRPLLCALLAVGALSGCSRGPVSVSGTVMLDDKPLPKTRVLLEPADGKGRPAYGETDESGRFSLTTKTPNDGVYPGQYKVIFAPIDPIVSLEKGAQQSSDPMKFARDFEARRQGAAAARRKEGIELHPNYTNVTTTPITLTIPPQGEVILKLKSDGT